MDGLLALPGLLILCMYSGHTCTNGSQDKAPGVWEGGLEVGTYRSASPSDGDDSRLSHDQ